MIINNIISCDIGIEDNTHIHLYAYEFKIESPENKIIRENKIRQAKLDAICNDTEFIWLDEYNEPKIYEPYVHKI